MALARVRKRVDCQMQGGGAGEKWREESLCQEDPTNLYGPWLFCRRRQPRTAGNAHASHVPSRYAESRPVPLCGAWGFTRQEPSFLALPTHPTYAQHWHITGDGVVQGCAPRLGILLPQDRLRCLPSPRRTAWQRHETITLSSSPSPPPTRHHSVRNVNWWSVRGSANHASMRPQQHR